MAVMALPSMSMPISAANGAEGDVLTIDRAAAKGSGWSRDGATLTLSGVSLKRISLSVLATILLE